MKKTMELCVLCDIQACMVITDVDGEVTTWPENQTQVMKILYSSKNVSPVPLLLAPALSSDDPLYGEDSVLEYLLKDSNFFVSAVSKKEGETNHNLDFQQLAHQNGFLDFQELMEKVDEKLQAVTERINFLESYSSSSSGVYVDENPSISVSVSEPDQSGQMATVVPATQSQTPFFDCFKESGFMEEVKTLFPKLCFLEENDGFAELFPI